MVGVQFDFVFHLSQAQEKQQQQKQEPGPALSFYLKERPYIYGTPSKAQVKSVRATKWQSDDWSIQERTCQKIGQDRSSKVRASQDRTGQHFKAGQGMKFSRTQFFCEPNFFLPNFFLLVGISNPQSPSEFVQKILQCKK